DQDRVVCIAAVVAQQLRWPVEVSNQQVYVAIVVDITKRYAAADAILSKHRTKLRGDFGKRRVVIVVVQQSRLPISRQLRIHVAVRDKQIHPTVVIIIEKLRPPADERQTHWRNLRGV